MTRLNTLFERAADKKSGGIRQDKLVKILPKGQTTSLKYDAMLKYDKKDKKDLRIISRGPFLAMFSQESVSFLNSLAVNERLERERRQRRHAQNQIESLSSFDSNQRERAQSAPSGMLRDISNSNLSNQKKKKTSKNKKKKDQNNGIQHVNEKKSSSSKRKSKGSRDKKSTDGKEKKKKSKEKGHRRRQSTSSGSSSSKSGKNKGKAKVKPEPYNPIDPSKLETSENEASGATLAISDSSLEPPSAIKISFQSDETKSDFSDSFGEIMISNDPSFTHLSYSYSISEDEFETTDTYETGDEKQMKDEANDEMLCSFFHSLSFFLRSLISKKESFVSKESTDFKKLQRMTIESYPQYMEGTNVPQTIVTRPKSILRNSGRVVPSNQDCPFRQSPSTRRKRNENTHYKFVR